MAYTRALAVLGKDRLLDDEAFLAELRGGQVPDHDAFPVPPALSDNGPQMTSSATRMFMAGARIVQHFGRPGTPNDQAWIESLSRRPHRAEGAHEARVATGENYARIPFSHSCGLWAFKTQSGEFSLTRLGSALRVPKIHLCRS
ncbi:hypothetical protein ACWEPC_08475 [Nonomuraea sp. NPDC004297]